MVNEEDLYTLKINCKGKKSIGKANKIINVEKNNRLFFKLKIKTIKREKKKNGRRKVKEIIIIIKKKNYTELQKSKSRQRFITTIKKCDWIYTYTYSYSPRKIKYNRLTQSTKETKNYIYQNKIN